MSELRVYSIGPNGAQHDYPIINIANNPIQSQVYVASPVDPNESIYQNQPVIHIQNQPNEQNAANACIGQIRPVRIQ